MRHVSTTPWRVLAATIALLVSPMCAAQLDLGGPLTRTPTADDAPEVELVPAYEARTSATPVPAERFAPMVLRIGPGRVQGIAVIEHRQDATQAVQTMVPFASTPDMWSEIPVTLNLPFGVESISIGLFDLTSERARPLRTETLDVSGAWAEPDEDRAFYVDRAVRLIAWIGSDPPRGVIESASAPSQQQGLNDPAGYLDVITLAPERVPRSRIAFDAFDAVVIRAGGIEQLDAGRLGALRAWVRSGGRVLILADEPGSAWRRGLSSGSDGDLVRVTEPASMPIPGSMLDEIGSGRDRTETPVWRAVRVTDAGATRGWRTRWRVSGDSTAEGTGLGLTAWGPVGLGWTGILGAEPSLILGSQDAAAVSELWARALAPAIEARSSETDDSSAPRTSPGQISTGVGSGATLTEQAAISAGAELVLDVPRLGHGPFVVIAGALVFLALLVGPLDMLVLGRLRLRRWSWLTVLVWTLVATVIALIGPRVVRQSDSRIGILEADDLIVEGAPGDPAASRGWTTSLIGMFAGGSSRVSVEESRNDSAWRGVSPLGRLSRRASLEPLAMLAGGLAGPSPAQPISMGMWTTRTVLRRAERTSPLHAAVSTLPGGGVGVTVTGLEPDERVKRAVVRTMEGSDELDLHPWAGTGLRAEASDLAPGAEPDTRWLLDSATDGMGAADRSISELTGPSVASWLPGATNRSGALERYMETGRWAVVQMEIEGGHAGFALEGGGQVRRVRSVRLLCPLGGSESISEESP